MDRPKLLVCDNNGKIFIHPSLEASGMKAGHFFILEPDELIKLPEDSRLYMMPNRVAIGYDRNARNFSSIGTGFAVSAFTPPGYTITFDSAYKENNTPAELPLFAYGAVAHYRGDLYAAAVRVDRDRRHDTRFIDINEVRANTKRIAKLFPKNRLIGHLTNCALKYCCPGAQNFFLGRYEGPLPTSPICNASCLGCISYQSRKGCTPAQPRIKFIPTPEEIVEVMTFHIKNVPDAVLSFGQGCEGEPLLSAKVIGQSIRLFRNKTSRGTININTNASRPKVLEKLFDLGLDSMRVSMNSCRRVYYTRYYKPEGYDFNDVMLSIKIAKDKNKFVSLNYLTMPGFTDSKEEFKVLRGVIKKYGIDMIQWRNLNFDPMRYFDVMKVDVKRADLLGVKQVIELLQKEFPNLRMGYFNPVL